METIRIKMENKENISSLKIIVDYDNRYRLPQGDGETIINLSGTMEKLNTSCSDNVGITMAVDKLLPIIRDYIIEGLTNCYVEYDENGREIFMPK